MRRPWLSIANGYVFTLRETFARANDSHKGAFDSFEHEHLPRTKYDQIIDETSNKPGEQAFEVSPRQHHCGPDPSSDRVHAK